MVPAANPAQIDFPPMQMQYWFEKRQTLKFVLHNCDQQNEIGQFDCTMAKIMGAKQQVLKGQIAEGEIFIRSASIQEQKPAENQAYSFTDFLRSGWEISQVIAIDYTGSNGD